MSASSNRRPSRSTRSGGLKTGADLVLTVYVLHVQMYTTLREREGGC
jgi:hypothetical protein